jgi:hypothetical protein
VQFAFPAKATLTNNTLENMTQITVYIPESGVTFRSVTARVSFDDIVTATGGTLTTKTLALQLGAAGYSTVTNSNSLNHTSTNQSFYLAQDYTAYFVSNWSGTSMTCDFQLQINQSTGTTLGMVNVCVVLDVTYDYADTSATQIKTVRIPLNGPTGALTVSDTTYDTMPALDYYLAEPSKTYRSIFITMEGMTHNNGSTTDHTITFHAGTATVTTGNYEASLVADRRYRYVWDVTSAWPSKTATQVFQLSDTVGRCNHPQAWLTVTYEFKADAATTTLSAGLPDGSGTTVSVVSAAALGTAPFVISIDNEQMLVTSIASNDLTVTRAYNGTTGVSHSNGATVSPCATNSVVLCGYGLAGMSGGTTSSDYQRFANSLRIEEPGPITAAKIAFLLDFNLTGVVAGLNVRVGTGSFVGYTVNSTLYAGSCGLMVRNDSAFTLARGNNNLTFDIYRTDTTVNNFMFGLTGRWIVNYVSAKSAAGYGAHNHTVAWTLAVSGTGAAPNTLTVAATSPNIPETDYFLSNVGTHYRSMPNSGVLPGQLYAAVERLAAEGGVRWDTIMSAAPISDSKVGDWVFTSDASRFFKRWPADTGYERFDLETSRRWRFAHSAGMYPLLQLWYTYHTCGPFVVSDSVTGSDGGTVTIGLYRSSDGELLKSTTRAGNGAYSFNWWDNTENVFTACTDATGHTARSKDGVATGSP